ncbi:MAG TPA: ATP-binding protein, partial [Anaerolineae bacterium]|nr:ATP-binding protein [Anaerolineae bacterium]
ANQAAAELLGVPAQELPGTRLDSYVLAADAATYGEHLAAVPSGDGARAVQWEMRVQQPGGQVIPTAVTATPVTATSRQTDGGREGVRWLLRDVRREKQMQAALVQAERMALTGQLAASLAHEINNPLTAALGSIELVREALEDGENPEPLLGVMHSSLTRAARIVSQLRDVRRHTRPEEKQPADLNTLVENVLLLAGKTASAAGVKISWPGANDLPALPLMIDGMQQVFLNLVLNAVEAMQGKGELAVRIRRAERPARIGVEFVDTGPGIAPRVRDRLFDPFETTKESGSGLGLFISKSIVEQHGGEIEVESVAGEGASFTVWLPV